MAFNYVVIFLYGEDDAVSYFHNANDVLRPFVEEEEDEGSVATAGSSNNDVADPVSASAEEQNYGGRHVEMAQQGDALENGCIAALIKRLISCMMHLRLHRETEPVQHLERDSSLERPTISQADEP